MKSKATARPSEKRINQVWWMEEASDRARLFHFPCMWQRVSAAAADPAVHLGHPNIDRIRICRLIV